MKQEKTDEKFVREELKKLVGEFHLEGVQITLTFERQKLYNAKIISVPEDRFLSIKFDTYVPKEKVRSTLVHELLHYIEEPLFDMFTAIIKSYDKKTREVLKDLYSLEEHKAVCKLEDIILKQ